jgi:hypothetical protein
MALVLADRVQEYSTTTGTGTLTLLGAYAGFQTFAAGIGNGNTCYYTITSDTNQWEVGIGTVGVGTLARTTLISSSTGSLVSFTGTLTVFVTYPAEEAVYGDGTTIIAPAGALLPVTSGGTGASTAAAARTALGLGTIATQAANAVAITGGAIDGTTIGSTTAAAGKFTTVTNSGLTTGRVVYTTTGGLEAASANLTFNGTTLTAANDASIAGMTVGLGGGSLAQNAAFGGVALPFNTTGNFNVAVGYQSMFYNKIGTSNVGLGFATLFLNTTANQNLAMGVSALSVLTTGVATLGAITAGSGYTNGTYTAVAMTPVSGATFVTYPTVTVVVSGGAVTSVTLVTAGQGASSLAATALTVAAALIGGTGSGFSIAVGSFVAGANNTGIGYQAGSTLATGSNNTLIGYQAAASSTTVSNEITLGNGSITAFRIPGLTITAGAKWMNFGSSTVALLAAAATAGLGARAFVTDALTPTFGSTVVGGGAVASPVYSDGTNWKVG